MVLTPGQPYSAVSQSARDLLAMISTLRLLLECGLAVCTYAAPLPHPAIPSTTEARPITSTSASSTWSNEAIFTLIGVIVAITGILVTLLLSFSKLREWISYPFKYCIKRNQQRSMRSLQNDVEEWLEFRQWSNLRRGRNAL
ncbi:hypothetical protein HBI26_231240 [Parastagonospora nodorum]|nr:hypothetical protein HBH46_048270 [Parastagonospora nodorum]KAH4356509.1 hypothetical protein HBH97_228850 [Parastagonospora nodorum]KAH4370650.1 hypothetical protein HBH99_238810 [Parastagonospora nodorum]KAH4692082.1 hypothetical protein HBH67_233420 [Parastagonospora nodorum]KAH5521833.1 hypothetical protein HBI29_058360 [Parastagonospora nodorum]